MSICCRTSWKILHPIECDDMNLKRIVRYMTGVPSARCLIEIVAFPQSADSHWAGQLRNLQQHERWSCTVEMCNEGGMVTNETGGIA